MIEHMKNGHAPSIVDGGVKWTSVKGISLRQTRVQFMDHPPFFQHSPSVEEGDSDVVKGSV